MEHEHIFGTGIRDGVMAENLKTVGEEHSAYAGYVEIRRSYDDCVIVDRFRIVEHYRAAEAEGLCYDWYTIDQHYRYIDTSGPVAAAAKNANEAVSIAFVSMAEAGGIDDTTAGEHIDLFEEWTFPVTYKPGQLRRDPLDGKLYRLNDGQGHTSQEGWNPSLTPALWTLAADPSEKWPAWSQPIGKDDAYKMDARVTHNGKRWICTEVDGAGNNVWEPGVYGWTEYTE